MNLDNLKFDGLFWKDKIELNLFGKRLQTGLLISGEQGSEIDSLQIKALECFINKMETLLRNSEDELFSHYQTQLQEYRFQYGDQADELSPIVSNKKDFSKLLNIESVYVPFSYVEDELELGLLFKSTYESEHGIAVKIVNGSVDEVGIQDIIL